MQKEKRKQGRTLESLWGEDRRASSCVFELSILLAPIARVDCYEPVV